MKFGKSATNKLVIIDADLTLFPINIFPLGNRVYQNGFGRQYLVNLSVLNITQNSVFQNVGNILLLVPLVYFIAILDVRFSQLKNAMLLGFLTSLAIEVLQFIMSYFYLGAHITDVNDVILNTLGALIGYVLSNLLFAKEIVLAR